MFVTNWISTTKIQKISEITNFFRHYFLSRTEVIWVLVIWYNSFCSLRFTFALHQMIYKCIILNEMPMDTKVRKMKDTR